MKITKIETAVAGNPWKNWLFVKVHTDDGLYGIGEGTINGFTRTCEAAIQDLSQLVIGQDPFRHESLSLVMRRDFYNEAGQVHGAAAAAIEMACLDITGKALGVPVWQLLGGQVRDRIRAYANGWYRCEREPSAFADAALKTVADGFNALKFDPFGAAHLHLDHGELNRSLAIVRDIRDAVGPEVDLMVEGHCRFTVGQAVEVGHRLREFNILWFEEPCPHHRLSDTIEVARRVPVPIGSGESISSKERFAELVSPGVIAVYQPEIMVLGGMRQARAVCSMVEAFNGVVAPHNAQGPVSTVACLHLAASCTNYLIQEYFDLYNESWENDLVTWHPTLDKDGTLNLPTGPGLGVDINFEVVKAHPGHPGNWLPLFDNAWNLRRGRAR